MSKKVYVEAGALDGVCGSRSLKYKDNPEYYGILIEPTECEYLKCVNNRANEHTSIYNCALVSLDYKQQRVTMHESTLHPGMNTCSIVDTTNLPTHTYTQTLFNAQARTLQSILDEKYINEIELFFLDVEGAEKDVIDGVDYTKTKINYLELELHHWRKMTLDAEIKMHTDNLVKFNMSLDHIVEECGGYKLYFINNDITKTN